MAVVGPYMAFMQIKGERNGRWPTSRKAVRKAQECSFACVPALYSIIQVRQRVAIEAVVQPLAGQHVGPPVNRSVYIQGKKNLNQLETCVSPPFI